MIDATQHHEAMRPFDGSYVGKVGDTKCIVDNRARDYAFKSPMTDFIVSVEGSSLTLRFVCWC
jgi:hypothetical protein